MANDNKRCFLVYARRYEDKLMPMMVEGTHFNWTETDGTLDIYDGEELVAVFRLVDIMGVASNVATTMAVCEEDGTWRLLNGANE